MSLQSTITAAAVTGLLAASSQAVTIFGLGSGGQLYSFDSAAPSIVTPVGVATAPGVVDIDFRGSNGKLYGITATGATSTISRTTGQLTPLFTPSTALSGVSGFDFNPTADRMRIVANGSNNFRMVPDGIGTGTGPMTPGTVTTDGSFALPASVTLLDVAYKNPFNGIAGTSLYSIGSNGVLYFHPTSGMPQFNTLEVVGNTGVTFSGNIGFDIIDDVGYVVDGTNFYTLNLTTGAASLAGILGQSLTSIAAVPEPSAALLGCVAGLGLLRRRRTA